MQMRNTLKIALISSILAGCGSGEAPITDPSKLTPLTDAQKAEAKQQDEQVRSEEGGSFDAKKKAK